MIKIRKMPAQFKAKIGKLWLIPIVSGWFLVFSSSSTFAATGINDTINFQGKVVNSNGTNVSNGDYDFQFKIYDAATDGNLLWTETWNSGTSQVTVTDGIFRVALGIYTDLPGSIDFNTDNIYLSINFNSDGEMDPRVRFTAVPYAFNAAKVAGLTVTDTTGTLTIPNGKTIQFADAFTTSGAFPLTLTTTASTNVTLPTAGTLVTNTASAVQTITSTQSTGIVLGITDSTDLTGAVKGLVVTLSGGNAFDQTGLEFNLSNASGSNLNDIVGTGGSWKVSKSGALTVVSCSGCGGGGGTLQQAYDAGSAGNQVITLDATQDSIVITNPSSSGSDSAFTFQINQNNTTAAVSILDLVQLSNAANGVNLTADSIDGETGLAITTNALTSGKGLTINSSSTAFTGALQEITLSGSNAANTGSILKLSNTGTANANTSLYIDHRATGTNNLALRIDDESGDTSPFIVDGDGRVGVGTQSITGSTERLLQVGSPTNRGNIAAYGDIVTHGLSDITALTNIRDIYMYDTTADSDGGKWVDWATTDKLSWFSETLDDGPNDPCNIASDDRCYTNNFPRKAIIVATLDDVYIFDAATNDMWMKFSQNAAGYALGVATNNDISSVTALNGVMYVATNGSANSGLYVIDFVNDRMWNIDGTDRSGANVGISGRNAAVTYNSDNTTAFDLSVTGTASEWEDLNDVSAVYITGSSTAIAIGAATNTSPGSGQTFVGLATNSGVTVINMTAQKLLQYSNATADDHTAVALTRRGRMYTLDTTLDELQRWNNFDTDKASEINGTPDKVWDETVGPALWNATPNIFTGAPDALEVIERGSLADDTSDIIYVGHSLGLTEIHDHATATNGWTKFFDTTRQTMFMPNAIDMALMMDDSSGTLANDISYNNTDMTILGSPTLGVSGVRGKAILFDNTDDYFCSDADQNGTCDVDTAFNMTTTGWTFSLWFKHSTTAPSSGADTLFEKCVTAVPAQATGCVIAYMTTTGTIVVANDDDATWTRPDVGAQSYDITGTSSLAYNDNQWHQLIISRTNANDVDTYIDGNPLNLSTATGLTATFDGSQIVTIGASCSTTTGANCAAATATNFWDGVIDDVTFSNGTTTVAQFSALQARRFYNDARPLLAKKVITVTDATTVSSTTIGDSGEVWIPNEFAGLIVTLTGDTGAGQTRRVISNDTTTLTVSPAFSTTPDTTTDFEVDPEALYGASNSVQAIGVTGEYPLGQSRQLCAGTNDGADGGGVTCYNHQAGPNIIADVYHGDSEHFDDAGNEWTGTDYDDIRSIDFSGRALVIGSEAHMYVETEDVRLGQALDYFSNQLFNVRSELINDGITLTGSLALEVGFTGGADLAEYYISEFPLDAGDVVSLNREAVGSVKRTVSSYQTDILGVVAAAPGLILGEATPQSYPVALVGRVPVKVISQNGLIKAGDKLTSSDVAGYAMKATLAGRIIGTALEDFDPGKSFTCPVDALLDEQCAKIMVFVNLTDYLGSPVELVMAEKNYESGIMNQGLVPSVIARSVNDEAISNNGIAALTTFARNDYGKQQQILSFLTQLKKEREQSAQATSEVFTDRVSAVNEIISPHVITELLTAKKIKADSIEGLEILTDKISSLQGQVAGLFVSKEATDSGVIAIPSLSREKQSSPSAEIAASPSTDAQGPRNDIEFESGKFTLDLTVLGKLNANGGLIVLGTSEFKGETVFERLVTFLSNVIFKGRVSFEEVPTFNKDTAGFALIKKGERKIKIEFEKEYEELPVVTINKLWEVEDDTLSVIDKLDGFFLSIQDYVLAGMTKKGFTIVLEEPAVTDYKFSWIALSIKEAKTFGKVEAASNKETFDLSQIKPSPWVDEGLPKISPTNPEPTVSLSPTPTPKDSYLTSEASSLAPVRSEPSGQAPTPVISPSATVLPTITILPNEYGFVRLRETPSIDGIEIGQLEVGVSYPFLEKRYDWYQIKTGDKTGWVSGTYVVEN